MLWPFLGGPVGLILLLLLTALFAKLIEAGRLPISWMDGLAYAVLLLSSFGGCFLSAQKAKRRCLLHTAITGGFFFLILCALNGLLQRGEFRRLLPTAGIVLASVLLASLLAAGKQMKSY